MRGGVASMYIYTHLAYLTTNLGNNVLVVLF
jgi:hypothetical protein